MINMGSMNGLYPEQKVVIYKANTFNATLGGGLVENLQTATGRVSNQIMPYNGWIVLDNSDYNSVVEVGDTIRLVY